MRTASVFRLALAATAIAGASVGLVQAQASSTQSNVICGNPPIKKVGSLKAEQGTCTYYPTSRYGALYVKGTVNATVVCAAGGYAQKTTTGGSGTVYFQRAVQNGLLACVLNYQAVGDFQIAAS